MAVLKKIRSRWLSQAPPPGDYPILADNVVSLAADPRYDIRPLSISQLDECWRLDQRCFVDGEAYSRDTFEYLLTAPEGRRHLAKRLMLRVEEGFRRRNIRMVRLEVRSLNVSAQELYLCLGYTVTQRLPKYYSNGGDGLLMVKSLA